MVIIGLAAGFIIGLIVVIKSIKDWGWEQVNIPFILLTTFAGTLVGFLLSAVIAVSSFGIPMIAEGEPVKTELIALEDGNGIHGSFYLGHSHVESNQYYYYLTKTPKGITQSKINVNQNKVYLRPDEFKGTPYFVTQKYKCGNEFINFLASGLLETTEYYFYIPPDSITYSYNIDLK